MRWSIHEVARISGVTARTLRHYDAVGLLPPASTGANGYRFYDHGQLLRLQEILLLRALGLDLATIAGILNGAGDRVAALRDHHRRLLAERSRLDRLARTVAETIAHLERGEDMAAEEMFDGFRFTRETLDDLEAIAADRSGGRVSPYFEEVRQRTAGWSAEDFRDAERAGADVEVRLLALLNEGKPADDPAVFDVLADDYAAQATMWTPTAEAYAQLGEAFANAPELRAHLDARDPRLAGYMRDAMVAYAAARLS